MNSLTMASLLFTLASTAVYAAPPRLPTGVLPDGLGVNIHFTDPRPGEMEVLHDGGFTWIRMDFDWNQIEYEAGKYRFDAYDRLMAALEAQHMRPIFILDYVHRLYDDAQSPHSDAAIAAFARFAAASARHYKGRGILWEMYNEPNIFPFWRPKPNVADYVRLATAVGKAIREAAPGEAYIGPAVSGFDWAFLEACFKGGLLEYWDAVSVHPYRQSAPETAIPDYARLRAMIRAHSPRGRRIPIISGEWGYSSVWSGMSPEAQGRMLARQWLTNVAEDVVLSIWYDWHDDGPDPKEPEHHFGTVLHPYHEAKTPVYDPKPAYLAARTLTRELRGYRFNKRLICGPSSNHVLLFIKGADVKIVAWTSSPAPIDCVIPASPGSLNPVDHLGNPLAPMKAEAGSGLRIRLTDAPVYLHPVSSNAILSVAASWERLPLDLWLPFRAKARVQARLRNSSGKAVSVRSLNGSENLAKHEQTTIAADVPLERSDIPEIARLEVRIEGSAPLVQETRIYVTDPIGAELSPPFGGRMTIRLWTPAEGAFSGTMVLRLGDPAVERKIPVHLGRGKSSDTFTVPIERTGPAFPVRGELRDDHGRKVRDLGSWRFVDVLSALSAPVSRLPHGIRLVPDGDPKVASTQSIASADPADGPAAKGLQSVRLRYKFDRGWKFLRIVADDDLLTPLAGKPDSLGMWLYGDGSGNIPRMRFADSSGQAWQPDGDPITWNGWKWITFRLDGSRSGHWGGPNDGALRPPLRWDTLFLLDSAGGSPTSGEVYIAGFTLIYKQEDTQLGSRF